MESLFPAPPILPNSSWSEEENKMFERAIAIYDENIPNRWSKVAAMLPGKSVFDVLNQYRQLAADVCDIEAGLVPIPGYFPSSVTPPQLLDKCGFRKSGKSLNQEKKKGLPWTEDEHRRFLMGLDKYGKGDWRNISRKLVISRTPAQVASHAQKYYQRQLNSGGKDKRRPSIHDITTVHFTCGEHSIKSLSNQKFGTISPLMHKFPTTTDHAVTSWWNNDDDHDLMAFGSYFDGLLVASPFDIASQDVLGLDIINGYLQF